MKSDVYFAKVNGAGIQERLQALQRLLQQARPFAAYNKNEFVPVKITVGDAPCVYHVHPQLAAAVIAGIKGRGAKPFLFDTSVIYQGERQNAVDHLNLIEKKGFVHATVGAPFIVADGVFGQDGKEYAIDSDEIKKIKVPSFVGMTERLVVLSHVTGHIVSGYAGSLKNVAMGMSCRPTKQVQHSSLKPSVVGEKCTGCGCCITICPVQAISRRGAAACIDQKACIGCGECLCACKFGAIALNWREDPRVFCRRMVEVARFILSRFKDAFFLNFAFDITKECDCISVKNEAMVASDIGILASTDPVSIDKATADLANENKISGYLPENNRTYGEMFAYAAKRGLGSLEYRLIPV